MTERRQFDCGLGVTVYGAVTYLGQSEAPPANEADWDATVDEVHARAELMLPVDVEGDLHPSIPSGLTLLGVYLGNGVSSAPGWLTVANPDGSLLRVCQIDVRGSTRAGVVAAGWRAIEAAVETLGSAIARRAVRNELRLARLAVAEGVPGAEETVRALKAAQALADMEE